MKNDNTKFIKSLRWGDVFDIWETNEATDESWILHATKDRGFASWQAWRQTHAHKLRLAGLKWGLFEITDTEKITSFHAGPFGAWAKYYGEKNSISFSELIKFPDAQANKRLQKMIKNFPDRMNLIGVVRPSGLITIIEGTHRCLAMAYLQSQGLDPQPQVQIALADYLEEKLPLVSKIKQ